MAIPLLNYALTTQTSLRPGVAALRVGSEEDPRAMRMDWAMDSENHKHVVEALYRQIFFHAFQSDRDPNLESQLLDGQITVRDFVRSLCLSDTFKRTFYGFNNNYKVIRHLTERLLGRNTHGKSEEISLSIILGSKGIEAMVDHLLDSDEYLDAFGYDTVPHQRNRVLPGRDVGETPFNITTPRYDEYYRSIFGFPMVVFTAAAGVAKPLPARARQRRGGFPEDYLPWVRSMPTMRGYGSSSNVNMDYLSKVPYRSVGR